MTNVNISNFSLFAVNSLYLRTGGKLKKGHVGVFKKSNTAKLGDDSELVLSENVYAGNDVSLYAHRVKIKPRSSVDDVYCNSIKNYATIRGNVFTPLGLPLGVALVGTGRLFTPAPAVIHCLLVETDDGLLLVDTGWGTRDCLKPTPFMRLMMDLGKNLFLIHVPKEPLLMNAILRSYQML